MSDAATSTVLAEVRAERHRQDTLWGQQNHQPFEWISIAGEELGEACEAVNKAHWDGGRWGRYREELLQLAAVAVAAIESYDRNINRWDE